MKDFLERSGVSPGQIVAGVIMVSDVLYACTCALSEKPDTTSLKSSDTPSAHEQVATPQCGDDMIIKIGDRVLRCFDGRVR
jgi:hypothetical protein